VYVRGAHEHENKASPTGCADPAERGPFALKMLPLADRSGAASTAAGPAGETGTDAPMLVGADMARANTCVVGTGIAGSGATALAAAGASARMGAGAWLVGGASDAEDAFGSKVCSASGPAISVLTRL
jgi:hypothetical protein